MANLQQQRRDKKYLTKEITGMDTRLKVMKIKQDRKLLQMKNLAEKVKQAEKWNYEK
jgi:hypothetical protein